jgi:flagellar export protein FliJ
MPFKFPLEPILNLRRSLEHQEELRLRLVHQLLHKLRHQIEQIDARALELEIFLLRQMSLGTTGAEMRAGEEIKTRLIQQRRERETEIIRIDNIREQQHLRFVEARRRREMLDILRDEQWHDYTQKAARQQQRNLDDLFLSRRLSKECR